MSNPTANITIPVDLTNPGQFFACCGLLELADRLWPGAEGWFERDRFCLAALGSLESILEVVGESTVTNTMPEAQHKRLGELSSMSKKTREQTPGLENEKKTLEALRRESPIILNGKVTFRIDWFCDDFAGGSRFKTWAGQQSVLDIAQAMHDGIRTAKILSGDDFWKPVRNIGLPFNFDSDLGGQGSGIDIGFVFDALAGNETTRIEVACRPALELLCFIGLQRFRPHEVARENRFVYVVWHVPLSPSIAAPVVSQSIPMTGQAFEFRLHYRTKYLKSFLPAQPYQGDHDE